MLWRLAAIIGVLASCHIVIIPFLATYRIKPTTLASRQAALQKSFTFGILLLYSYLSRSGVLPNYTCFGVMPTFSSHSSALQYTGSNSRLRTTISKIWGCRQIFWRICRITIFFLALSESCRPQNFQPYFTSVSVKVFHNHQRLAAFNVLHYGALLTSIPP